ncbi:MAG: FecR family protein [Sphingopyxis sp.]
MSYSDDRTIEEQAALWVMRIDREGRSAVVNLEIEEWIGDDDRKRGALLQAEAAWAMLDAGFAEPAVAEPESHDGASDWDDQEVEGPRPLWRRRAFGAGAMGLFAASLVFGVFVGGSPDQYETRIGEVRRVPLADGSIAAINTSSKLDVTMRDKSRIATLTKGEAWFQVAKDPERPFIVEAGAVRVRAVGTAFSVRIVGDGAEVLVTEGIVEAWSQVAGGQRIRLRAGERAFVAGNAEVRTEEPGGGEVDRALAWRSGKLDLAGETLTYAIEELNRYNARKIVLQNPEYGQERLYGIFRTDDPELFARTVGESLELRVDVESNQIALSAR